MNDTQTELAELAEAVVDAYKLFIEPAALHRHTLLSELNDPASAFLDRVTIEELRALIRTAGYD